MKESIFKSINKGIESYLKLSRDKWYVSNISQALLIITQYAWTLNTECKLQEMADSGEGDLEETKEDTENNLKTLVKLVR